jgi:flagellar protein FliL
MEREESVQVVGAGRSASVSLAGTAGVTLAAIAALLLGGVLGLLVAGPKMTSLVLGDPVADTPAGAPGGRTRAERSGKSEPTAIYSIDNLVVNPYGTRGTRFLMISLTMELDAVKTGEALKARDAEIRDRMLEILGGKTVEELVAVEARDELRRELQAATQALLREGQVLRIHLPQFVIQ